MKAISRTILMALFAALLTACAGTGTGASAGKRGGTPEEQVSARAEARWKHVLAFELPQAYAFYTPGYREANSFERYTNFIQNRRVQWTGAKVKSVTCTAPERCVANVAVDYKLIGGMPGAPDVGATQVVEETWLLVDGAWYHLPTRSLP